MYTSIGRKSPHTVENEHIAHSFSFKRRLAAEGSFMIMIGNSMLKIGVGSRQVTLDELDQLHTPKRTLSHVPIPHYDLFRMVRHSLSACGFGINSEAHVVNGKDNAKYFSLLQIVDRRRDIDLLGTQREFVFGVRNSHDKSIAAEGVLGERVFVCDNLAFSSSGVSSFKFGRKHTSGVLRDIENLITQEIEGLRSACYVLDRVTSDRKEFNFDKEEDRKSARRGSLVRDLVCRLVEKKVILPSDSLKVLQEFYRADGVGGIYERFGTEDHIMDQFGTPIAYRHDWSEPTMWRLQQAITEVDKSRPITAIEKRHSRMSTEMGLAMAYAIR